MVYFFLHTSIFCRQNKRVSFTETDYLLITSYGICPASYPTGTKLSAVNAAAILGALLNATRNSNVSMIYQSINLHSFLSIIHGGIFQWMDENVNEKIPPKTNRARHLVHNDAPKKDVSNKTDYKMYFWMVRVFSCWQPLKVFSGNKKQSPRLEKLSTMHE